MSISVGLTGGIASGKSTVSARLVELGVVLVDADALAREVVAPGTPGLAAVVAEFGEGVLTEDGGLRTTQCRGRRGDGGSAGQFGQLGGPTEGVCRRRPNPDGHQ